jgi:hypothetical protein
LADGFGNPRYCRLGNRRYLENGIALMDRFGIENMLWLT